MTETLYAAIRGEGAWRNGEPWQLEVSPGEAKELDRGGAVMNACWVLEEAPARFVKKPKVQDGCGCLWDYAATACLYEELGAYARDFHGEPLDLNASHSVFMNQKGVVLSSEHS